MSLTTLQRPKNTAPIADYSVFSSRIEGSLRHLGWITATTMPSAWSSTTYAPTFPKTVPSANEINLKNAFPSIALISFGLLFIMTYIALLTGAPIVW